MRLILIHRYLALALVFVAAPPLPGQAHDSLAAARRIVAAASLAAKEYALGVAPAGGQVLLAGEAEEARLFIAQSRFDVPYLPAEIRGAVDADFAALIRHIEGLAPPADVDARVRQLVARVAGAVRGAIETLPARAPSLARGAEVYRAQCSECHGLAGRGDGSKAATLEGPPPASLADPGVMAGADPVDIFRRVAIGVPGTAMPEFEQDLPLDDRWAVTAYVMTLSGGSGLVHAAGGVTPAHVFARVRRQIDSAVALRSERVAFDAYLSFEGVETEVRAKEPALAGALEVDFARLRGDVTTANVEALAELEQRLLASLERAERVVADRGSRASLFAQSLLLMLREGFEAILIIGALMAFLAKAGANARRRDVARGAWAAVAASLVTWVLVELLFHITPSQREALEGVTMLLATAVLFYVSYWLLSKIEAARWNAFVKGKMEAALSTGSGLALAAVAFLAVYREGFETILFYKALLGSSGSAGVAPVVVGIAVGAILLVGVYLGVTYTGFRLPLKPFFAVTSAMLYYMAFVFAGKGIAELQGAGVVTLTPLAWAPRAPFIGVYPTAESLVLQGVLLALAVAALVWVRVAARPAPAPPPAVSTVPPVPAAPGAVPPPTRGGTPPPPTRRSRSPVS